MFSIKALFAPLFMVALCGTIAPTYNAQAQQPSRNNLTEIIIISRHGCGPCRTLVSQLDQLKKAVGNINIRIIYADNSAAVSAIEKEFNIHISGFPTTLIVVNGIVKQLFAGYRNVDHWYAQLNKELLS